MADGMFCIGGLRGDGVHCNAVMQSQQEGRSVHKVPICTAYGAYIKRCSIYNGSEN